MEVFQRPFKWPRRSITFLSCKTLKGPRKKTEETGRAPHNIRADTRIGAFPPESLSRITGRDRIVQDDLFGNRPCLAGERIEYRLGRLHDGLSTRILDGSMTSPLPSPDLQESPVGRSSRQVVLGIPGPCECVFRLVR